MGVVLLINSFHELSDDQRHTLDALDFLLCSHKLALEISIKLSANSLVQLCRLQAPLLILDILFLQVDVPIFNLVKLGLRCL